ncbi:MAG: sulfotransferase domain-containing protein [Spirochaetales bacterium]|nr:sulfotransferase domain-containing protein [Spirochaetales bacterium]
MANVSIFKKAYTKFIDSKVIRRIIGSDIFLFISHPKSGRTWLKVVLSKYISLLYKQPENYLFISHYRNLNIPKLVFTHLRTHKDFTIEDVKPLKNQNIIFLVRDPRDVVVSYFYQRSKRKVSHPFSGKINEFIRSPKFGIEQIINYMNLLISAEKISKKFLLITYENMHKSFNTELKKIINFIKLPYNDKHAKMAIKHGDFKRMKEMERKNKYKSNALSVKNPNDKNAYKVRSGKIGDYVNHLSKTEIAFIDKKINDTLSDTFSYYKQNNASK